MSGYGLTTFSPKGTLPQIEYATNAVSQGTTSLGIKCSEGVTIAAEKKTSSSLVDPASVQKVFVLDDHAGCTYSGMGPDSRLIIAKARKICQVYRLTYNEPMPLGQLTREVAEVYQEFTQSGGARPFGVSLLIAGVDTFGHHLYQVDPSGTFIPWKATSIGKNATNAKDILQKRYTNDFSLDDTTHTALLTLKEGFDGIMTEKTTEVGRVIGNRFELLSPKEVKDYLEQV